MSTDRIAKIRARLAAATPGPWTSQAVWTSAVALEGGGTTHAVHLERDGTYSHVATVKRRDNAALIAAAPADLAYLLAIVDAADELRCAITCPLGHPGWPIGCRCHVCESMHAYDDTRGGR